MREHAQARLHRKLEPLRAVEIQDCRTQLIEVHLCVAVGIGEHLGHFLHLGGIDDGNAVTRNDLGSILCHHGHRHVVCVLQRRIDQHASGLPIGPMPPNAEHVVVHCEQRAVVLSEQRHREAQVGGIAGNGLAVRVDLSPTLDGVFVGALRIAPF